MTDEEINRKFDLVAEHLATLAVGLEQLAETQRRSEERWERTEGSIRSLLAVAEIQSEEIRHLGEAVKTIDERQRQTDERLRQTDERLNALIDLFERDISDRQGHNRNAGESNGGQSEQ